MMDKSYCALFLVVLVLSSVVLINGQPPQICSNRENYDPCAHPCEELCLYGTYMDQGFKCASTGSCAERKCSCAYGFIRDPESKQCWKRTYCTWRITKTRLQRILGSWNIFGF